MHYLFSPVSMIEQCWTSLQGYTTPLLSTPPQTLIRLDPSMRWQCLNQAIPLIRWVRQAPLTYNLCTRLATLSWRCDPLFMVWMWCSNRLTVNKNDPLAGWISLVNWPGYLDGRMQQIDGLGFLLSVPTCYMQQPMETVIEQNSTQLLLLPFLFLLFWVKKIS